MSLNDSCIIDYTKWVQTFIIFPRKTRKGKWIYLQKAYTRCTWTPYNDYEHMYPTREWATLFDVLRYAK